MSRRRSKANQMVVIYWRDIPAQVTASNGGQTVKRLLEPRFQHAIDRAAGVAGLTETSAYVAQWRRQAIALGPDDDASEHAERTAGELEQAFDRDRLEALVKAGGASDTDSPTPVAE